MRKGLGRQLFEFSGILRTLSFDGDFRRKSPRMCRRFWGQLEKRGVTSIRAKGWSNKAAKPCGQAGENDPKFVYVRTVSWA